MAKIQVRPNRDVVPPHPIDGKLRPEGGLWTADQYTFRLIRDGDIIEVPPEGGGDPQRARSPATAPEPGGDEPEPGGGEPTHKTNKRPR
jgi:hypothetical protein